MSEDGETRAPVDRHVPENDRGGATRLLAGRIACVLGLVLAVGGIVAALVEGGANISPGAVGILLSVLGYFLGARRLAVATVVVSILALFFGLAAAQGLIPGLEPTDRSLPAREPRAE